jgi:hypothetical protein
MSVEVILSSALTPEERLYLLNWLREPLAYYEMLMGLPEVSEYHKDCYHLVKGIIDKLRT